MTSPRDTYLSFLDQYELNLALNSQWVLLIYDFPQVISSQIAQLDGTTTNDWNIAASFQNLTSKPLQTSMEVGCFFIDNVSLPGERYDSPSVGNYDFGGFMKPVVTGARQGIASKSLTTTFRETNQDFIESVIRPWIITASYRGYFAYENANQRVRASQIQLISFGRQSQSSRPVRKIYNFYNVAPLGVDDKRYNYGEDASTADLLRSVSWSFDTYSVNPK